jgi:quercetin dioxygenase-like cupin family protein
MQKTTDQKFIKDAAVAWQDMGGGVRRKIMAFEDSIMLVRVEFETGGVGSLHSHPHVQISHVESGQFEIEIEGVKKTLSAGDVFHVPSNAIHGAYCIEAGVLIDVFSPMREDFLTTI